jgi:hypothetical protein
MFSVKQVYKESEKLSEGRLVQESFWAFLHSQEAVTLSADQIRWSLVLAVLAPNTSDNLRSRSEMDTGLSFRERPSSKCNSFQQVKDKPIVPRHLREACHACNSMGERRADQAELGIHSTQSWQPSLFLTFQWCPSLVQQTEREALIEAILRYQELLVRLGHGPEAQAISSSLVAARRVQRRLRSASLLRRS